MIRPLRKYHRIAWLLLSIITIVALGFGFMASRRYHEYLKHHEVHTMTPSAIKSMSKL